MNSSNPEIDSADIPKPRHVDPIYNHYNSFTYPHYSAQYPFTIDPNNIPSLERDIRRLQFSLDRRFDLLDKHLELIHAQFNLLDIKIHNLDKKMDTIDIENKIRTQNIDKKIEAIDKKLDKHNRPRMINRSQFSMPTMPLIPPIESEKVYPKFNTPPSIYSYKDNKNNKDNKDNKDNINTKQSLNKKQPPKVTTPEISMIIHTDDLKSGKGQDPFGSLNPFGFLTSIIKQIDKKNTLNNKEKEKEKQEDEYEDTISEYDSDDEFEELDLNITKIDDLINLGNKFDELNNKIKPNLKPIISKNKSIKEDNSENKEDEDEDEDDDDIDDNDIDDNDNYEKDEDISSDDSSQDCDTNPPNTSQYKIKPKDTTNKHVLKKIIEKKEKPINNNNNKDNKKNDKEEKKSIFKLNGKQYSIDLEKVKKLQEPLKKLHSMIGLEAVKTSVVDMILYYLQNFEKRNNNMLHSVIEGPPGVGKTELGKILAEIYAGLGVIKSSKFKVVKRTDLVGEYLGHTAHRTQQAIDEADGGVLFIDEAYSLGNEEKRDSFAKECIDVINQNLSENKRKFICIIAGYHDELESCFFSYNPGLRRRFPFRYKIDGYSPEELRDIFLKKLKDSQWKLNEKDIDYNKLTQFFKDNKNEFQYFGGDIENLLVKCKFMHSRRIVGKHPKFRRILTNNDIDNGLKKFIEGKKKKEDHFPQMMMYT